MAWTPFTPLPDQPYQPLNVQPMFAAAAAKAKAKGTAAAALETPDIKYIDWSPKDVERGRALQQKLDESKEKIANELMKGDISDATISDLMNFRKEYKEIFGQEGEATRLATNLKNFKETVKEGRKLVNAYNKSGGTKGMSPEDFPLYMQRAKDQYLEQGGIGEADEYQAFSPEEMIGVTDFFQEARDIAKQMPTMTNEQLGQYLYKFGFKREAIDRMIKTKDYNAITNAVISALANDPRHRAYFDQYARLRSNDPLEQAALKNQLIAQAAHQAGLIEQELGITYNRNMTTDDLLKMEAKRAAKKADELLSTFQAPGQVSAQAFGENIEEVNIAIKEAEENGDTKTAQKIRNFKTIMTDAYMNSLEGEIHKETLQNRPVAPDFLSEDVYNLLETLLKDTNVPFEASIRKGLVPKSEEKEELRKLIKGEENDPEVQFMIGGTQAMELYELLHGDRDFKKKIYKNIDERDISEEYKEKLKQEADKRLSPFSEKEKEQIFQWANNLYDWQDEDGLVAEESFNNWMKKGAAFEDVSHELGIDAQKALSAPLKKIMESFDEDDYTRTSGDGEIKHENIDWSKSTVKGVVEPSPYFSDGQIEIKVAKKEGVNEGPDEEIIRITPNLNNPDVGFGNFYHELISKLDIGERFKKKDITTEYLDNTDISGELGLQGVPKYEIKPYGGINSKMHKVQLADNYNLSVSDAMNVKIPGIKRNINYYLEEGLDNNEKNKLNEIGLENINEEWIKDNKDLYNKINSILENNDFIFTDRMNAVLFAPKIDDYVKKISSPQLPDKTMGK